MKLLTSLVAILLLSMAAFEQNMKVVGITDGDTIAVIDSAKRQLKIRLAGIDAPEKNQDFGNRSEQNLSNLVFGKTVRLDGDKIDRYGRRVCKVIVNGEDANLEQVRSGLAWHFKRYQSKQTLADRRPYAIAETEAKKAKRNIWSIPDPVAPWDYRSPKKRNDRILSAVSF